MHADEAQLARGRQVTRPAWQLESLAIVVHGYPDPALAKFHHRHNLRGLGMSPDVAERFLNDAEQRQFRFGRRRLSPCTSSSAFTLFSSIRLEVSHSSAGSRPKSSNTEGHRSR